MKYLIISTVLLLVSFLGGMFYYRNTHKENPIRVTSSMLESRLAECSDLTTCRLEYVDLVKYSNGNIPLFTKRSFSMIYSADIRAGVDLSQAKVNISKQYIEIVLPPTQVQNIEVNTDSLRFYDERFALFSWSNKEDISQAIKIAREDALKHANIDKLKAQARKQAEAVIYKLMAIGYRKAILEILTFAEEDMITTSG